jgi:hypothetical protein
VSYRRQVHLEAILAAWLKETADVWLCDCSKNGYNCTLPVNIVHAWPDPGNRIRHAVALMTSGDLVIKADDDIVPGPGLAQEFVKAHEAKGDAIYGIHGRRFKGPRYYGNTQLFGPGNANGIQEVDFVGVITCAPRQYLPMDLKGCRSEIEDLYWQMGCYPQVKKYVIGTKNVRHLPESFDAGRLCAVGPSRNIRQQFYQAMYLRHYAQRGHA